MELSWIVVYWQVLHYYIEILPEKQPEPEAETSLV